MVRYRSLRGLLGRLPGRSALHAIPVTRARALSFAAVAILTTIVTIAVLESPIIGLALLVLTVLAFVLRRPRGTAALTAIVALFFPPTIAFGWPIETVTLVMLIASASAIVGSVQRALSKPGSVHFAAGGVLFLAAAVVLASLLTGSAAEPIAIAVRPYLFAFAMTWYFTNEARIDPIGFRRMLLMIAWLAAAVSVLALVQRATGTWPILDELATGVQYTSRAYGGRPGGTMGHPILFGAVAALGALLAITQRGRFWPIAFILCTVGVIASGSRSAFFAIGLGLIVYVLDRSRDRLLNAKTVTLGLVTAAVVLPFFLTSTAVGEFIDDLSKRLQISGDISGDARSLRIDVAFARIFSSPETTLVGHGALSDSAYLTAYGIGDGQAATFDNMYISIWHNFGLLGLIPLVMLLVVLVVRGNARSRPIVVAFAAILFFVDITAWPALITIGALGAALTPPRKSNTGGDEERAHLHPEKRALRHI